MFAVSFLISYAIVHITMPHFLDPERERAGAKNNFFGFLFFFSNLRASFKITKSYQEEE